MALDTKQVRALLQQFDLRKLFIEELGWDHHQAAFDVSLDDRTYQLSAVAHKRGVIAFVCKPTSAADLPDYATRRKIERVVAKTHAEHLIVFVDPAQTTQLWQWVKREPGRPAASREHTWHKSQSGEALIQKLGRLVFTLAEEEGVTILDSTGRVRAGFDVERVTKRFYERFKTEHGAFTSFIKGIPDDEMLRWYVSVMLNRLMFIYFIQKKGFLNGDPAYLRNKLAASKQAGKDRFYKHFLCPLFFEGFAVKADERSPATNALLGQVPYLNGGLFLRHQIEEQCGEKIQIADAAFEKIFDFFDAYQWHLDERPLRQDDEINPDVLGYIFEKYINQKQMGAYYTKEDITEYIGKNTIVPFLFDAARKECPIAFKPGSFLWKLLSEDPDRYIYAAVRKGVIDDTGHVIPLPDAIEPGIADVSQRGGWNKPADAAFALPTETWREHVARRQRCLEIRRKLRDGEVHEINDLITLNLDIRQFAQDVIAHSEGPELVRAFYQAIEKLTVLDPTCGSGAFLFAALNVLQPLYEACLERMAAFLAEAERGKVGPRPEKFADFRKVLDRIKLHPNHDYFVLKSIIVNNLYGVDIMEEAVEICRLRLFLKLVAQVEKVDQIEPLPDIDFNIRAGNTLVGFASFDQAKKSIEFGSLDFGNVSSLIQQKAELVEMNFNRFRKSQIAEGKEQSTEFTRLMKQAILKPLNELRQELDKYLAVDYGFLGEKKLAEFRVSHQPFHWFVEFYGIMRDGGFDVIVGNPPYVATSKVRKSYAVRGYATERCTDIYAWCLERVAQLANDRANTGMIVPLSLGFSGDFVSLRSLLYKTYQSNWFSSFGRIPAALFAHDVRVRNIIHIGSKRMVGGNFTTRLHRWFDMERPTLFQLLSYAGYDQTRWSGRIPKLNTTRLVQAFEALASGRSTVSDSLASGETRHRLHFKKTAYNWLNFCRQLPPCYDEAGNPIEHTEFGELFLRDAACAATALLLLNGKLQMSFWLATGDDFHVTKWMFADLPVDLGAVPSNKHARLIDLADELNEAMKAVTSFKLNAGKRVGNYNLARCRDVTDKSDHIFAKALGFDAVWEDVELLYTQCVRTDFGEDDGDD